MSHHRGQVQCTTCPGTVVLGGILRLTTEGRHSRFSGATGLGTVVLGGILCLITEGRFSGTARQTCSQRTQLKADHRL